MSTYENDLNKRLQEIETLTKRQSREQARRTIEHIVDDTLDHHFEPEHSESFDKRRERRKKKRSKHDEDYSSENELTSKLKIMNDSDYRRHRIDETNRDEVNISDDEYFRERRRRREEKREERRKHRERFNINTGHENHHQHQIVTDSDEIKHHNNNKRYMTASYDYNSMSHRQTDKNLDSYGKNNKERELDNLKLLSVPSLSHQNHHTQSNNPAANFINADDIPQYHYVPPPIQNSVLNHPNNSLHLNLHQHHQLLSHQHSTPSFAPAGPVMYSQTEFDAFLEKKVQLVLQEFEKDRLNLLQERDTMLLDARDQMKRLEDELDRSVRSAKVEQDLTLRNARTDVLKIQEENEQLKDRLRQCELKERTLEADIESISRKNRELETSLLNEKQLKLSHQSSEKLSLSNEIRELQNRLDASTIRESAIKRLEESLINKVNAQEREIENLIMENRRNDSKVNVAEQDRSNSVAEKDKISGELQSLKLSVKTLEQHLSDRTSDFEASTREIQRLKVFQQTHIEAKDRLEVQLATIQGENSDLKRLNAKMKKELEDTAFENSQLRRSLAQMRKHSANNSFSQNHNGDNSNNASKNGYVFEHSTIPSVKVSNSYNLSSTPRQGANIQTGGYSPSNTASHNNHKLDANFINSSHIPNWHNSDSNEALSSYPKFPSSPSNLQTNYHLDANPGILSNNNNIVFDHENKRKVPLVASNLDLIVNNNMPPAGATSTALAHSFGGRPVSPNGEIRSTTGRTSHHVNDSSINFFVNENTNKDRLASLYSNLNVNNQMVNNPASKGDNVVPYGTDNQIEVEIHTTSQHLLILSQERDEIEHKLSKYPANSMGKTVAERRERIALEARLQVLEVDITKARQTLRKTGRLKL